MPKNKLGQIREELETAKELNDGAKNLKTCDRAYDCQGNRGSYGIVVQKNDIEIFYDGKSLNITDNEARELLSMLKNLFESEVIP